MSDNPVTLEFLARQQARLLDEMASLREQIRDLIGRFTRIECNLNALLRDIHAK